MVSQIQPVSLLGSGSVPGQRGGEVRQQRFRVSSHAGGGVEGGGRPGPQHGVGLHTEGQVPVLALWEGGVWPQRLLSTPGQ